MGGASTIIRAVAGPLSPGRNAGSGLKTEARTDRAARGSKRISSRSASVRIKLGIKTWSTLSAMLLSVAMISGCNEEPASNSPAPGGAGAGKPADGKGPGGAPAIPPPTPKEEKKP
jgi:hypothetical protein